MPAGFPSLTPEQKQAVLKRVKENGERVPDLAKEYGINPKSIYGMLSRSATTPNTLLELARLKREHTALLTIIGQLTAERRLGKKI